MGEAVVLNRTKTISLIAAAVFLLAPMAFVRAQGLGKRILTTPEELFHALVEAESVGQTQVELLCLQYRELLTPDLCRWLRNRAAMIARGDATQSIRAYRTSLSVADSLQDDAIRAPIELSIGRKLIELRQLAEAIVVLAQSRAHFSNKGLRHDEQFVCSQLAFASLLQQDFANATLHAASALELASDLVDKPDENHAWPVQFGEAIAESVLAHISARGQRYPEAIDKFERALELFQGLQPRLPMYEHYITDTLDSLGDAYSQSGEYGWALVYLERALAKARENALFTLEAGILERLGVLFLKREDCGRAEDYFLRSLRLATDIGSTRAVGRAELALGIIAVRRNQLDSALPRFQICLELAQASTDADLIILARLHLASIYLARGDIRGSLAESKISEDLAARDPLRTAEGMLLKADIQRRLGETEEAIDNANKANAIALEHGLKRLSYFAYLSLVETYSAANRADESESELHKALELLEDLRAQVPGDFHHRQLFFGRSLSAYHLLIDLLQKQGRLMEALSYAERVRARALLDRLFSIRSRDTSILTEAEHSEEHRLSREVASYGRDVRSARGDGNVGRAELDAMHSKLREKRSEYATFREILQTLHPELRISKVVPAQIEASTLLKILPDNRSALLQFVVTENKLLLFVARRRGDGVLDLRVYPTEVSRTDVEKQVTRFHWLMSNRHPSFRTESRGLYDLLIKPAEKQLAGSSRWCIVPDDLLWKVPFQVLEPRGARYLIEDVTISYAPSLAFIQESSHRVVTNTNSLLAFGDPRQGSSSRDGEGQQPLYEPLPEAAAEVRSIASKFGSQRRAVFVGPMASESTFKSKAGGYDVIHLATHGVLDPTNPLYSFLLLTEGEGEDGILEAREVLEMDLRADLVVLSACGTGQGMIGEGEGVIGITWAFLAAGARAAVVSQWAVKSGTSSRQMMNFYNQLKPGASKAEALRQSALEMLRGSQFNHPFYWASFVVIGSDR
jgi:CHAT domain-containing protein/tetratricopeptide (TPR) repeat protein